MEAIFTSFLVSVIAGVVSYYSNSLNGTAPRNEQESPQSGNSEGFRFASWKFHFIS